MRTSWPFLEVGGLFCGCPCHMGSVALEQDMLKSAGTRLGAFLRPRAAT